MTNATQNIVVWWWFTSLLCNIWYEPTNADNTKTFGI